MRRPFVATRAMLPFRAVRVRRQRVAARRRRRVAAHAARNASTHRARRPLAAKLPRCLSTATRHRRTSASHKTPRRHRQGKRLRETAVARALPRARGPRIGLGPRRPDSHRKLRASNPRDSRVPRVTGQARRVAAPSPSRTRPPSADGGLAHDVVERRRRLFEDEELVHQELAGGQREQREQEQHEQERACALLRDTAAGRGESGAHVGKDRARSADRKPRSRRSTNRLGSRRARPVSSRVNPSDLNFECRNSASRSDRACCKAS